MDKEKNSKIQELEEKLDTVGMLYMKQKKHLDKIDQFNMKQKKDSEKHISKRCQFCLLCETKLAECHTRQKKMAAIR